MPSSCSEKGQSTLLNRMSTPLAVSRNPVFLKLLRMLGLGAGLLPAGCSECCPPEAVLGSRAEADLEGGVGSGPAFGSLPEM